MAKEDIQKLLDEAASALESEYDDQASKIKSDIKSFKAKTLDKISKSTP